ncbi:hypothetical protein EJ03DRAFT_349708 [Teratosphaeria nubilosa]|uniref:Uncharacterized protein n=1 Tax=Teratosphaeria nubilosa TaxID=161662 RepID=A0A6G1LED1_9PEZI|nr:hypothetical protein EJ03DRAFT_349708 [Teratosphaeria nubilosa]
MQTHNTAPSFCNYLPQHTFASSPATGANTSEEEIALIEYDETVQEGVTDIKRRSGSSSSQDTSTRYFERPTSESDQNQTISSDNSSYAGSQNLSRSRSQTTESELATRTAAGLTQRKRGGKGREQRNERRAGASAFTNAPPSAPTGTASSRKASSNAQAIPQGPRQMQKTSTAHNGPSDGPVAAPTAPQAMRREQISHELASSIGMRHGRQQNARRSILPPPAAEPEDLGISFKGAAGPSQTTELLGPVRAVHQDSRDEYARERRERDEQRRRSKMQRSRQTPAQKTGRREQNFDEDAMDWECS